MIIKSLRTNLLAALLGGLVYTWLFRHWTAGLNVLLFDLLMIGAVAVLRPEERDSAPVRFAGAALLFSSVCVVLVHTWLASFTHLVCFWLFLGTLQAREIRFVWFSLLLGVVGLFGGWLRAVRYGRQVLLPRDGPAGTWRLALPWLRLVLLPMLLIVPFVLLYFVGNAAFAEWIFALGTWLTSFGLPQVDGSLLLLFGFGTTLGFALLLPRWYSPLTLQYALDLPDELTRRRRRWHQYLSSGSLALLREYRIAMISLGFLNVLLFFVNLLDLRYVWLTTRTFSAAELSSFVHEGTASLTVSLLLAMAVVLVFFRGNLNFLPRARPLYTLTYLWLGQNALLAVSVAVRNGRYIAAYGLAEGRIIVAFFLSLVFLGLWTLYRKVRYRKSLAYLFQRNGLNLLAALLIFSALNWNVLITRYNLSVPTRAGIDWQYLGHGLPGSDNLFLLVDDPRTSRTNREEFRLTLTREKENFAQLPWLAWNWPDFRNSRAMVPLSGNRDESRSR